MARAIAKIKPLPKPKRLKKGYVADLPAPQFSDGGNRYIGKTVENSQIKCLLCEVYGCGCVHPSQTIHDLDRALTGKISYAIFATTTNLSFADKAEKARLAKMLPIWEEWKADIGLTYGLR